MSKIKKLLGMLVCCGILSCMLPMAAYATEGEVEFEESGYTYDQEAGTLVIHTQEGIEEFENDVESWKWNFSTLTIESGVTEIPADAFNDAYCLKELVFEGPITIHTNGQEGIMPFYGCDELEFITFGGAAVIEDGAFNGLWMLKEVVFPVGSTLGNAVFRNCEYLEKVVFEGDVTVGSGAFNYCITLKEVTFEGDAEIGSGAFCGCYEMEKLIFNGESVIGISAFQYTKSLKEIYFAEKTQVGAASFIYGEEERQSGGELGPEMMSNVVLKSLTFPAGSTLGSAVFQYCRGLESLTFEGDIVLDSGPFMYATGLKSIVFGGTCVLKSSPFKDATAIESITFGGAAALDNGVFMQTNVKSLDFPAGSTFKMSDFANAPELETLIFRGDVELRDGGTFANVPKLKTLVFEGESIIGSGVFSTTPELETVTFGKKVTFTGSGGFYSSKVTELVFPEGSSLSAGNMFYETPELRKVVFEGDVVLGNAVISKAGKLEEVIFKGTSEIAAGSIYEVPKLQKLVFEKAVKLTGAAFYNAGTTADKPIESIVLPAGSEVYNWVTMANVNYIEFQDLEVPDFSYGLFSNLPTSTVIYVPCTVLEDYKAAIKTVIENAIVQDESKRINFEDLKIEGKHSYTLQKDETNHWKECACQDKIEVEEHTYGEWAVTKEPTTSEVGQKERACVVCGYKETAEIEKLQPTPTPAPTPAPTTEPESLKEMVDDLSVLVDENATKEAKVEAVKDIVEKVKEMVKDDNVAELTTSYIEEMEATIAEATGRTLNIISKDEELPTISAVAGAFLGLNPEEDGSIVFETVEEEDIPTMDEKYANGYAFDIQLFEGDDKTQPIVPVTIRMILPKSIDPNAKIVVLHYANGATTPEVLSPTVKDGAIEFTTSSFSTFVITNEVESQNSGTTGGNAGEAAPAPTAAPTPAPTPAPTEAPSVGSENPAPKTGDNANPMIAVFVMCFATLGLAYAVRTRKSENNQ